MMKNRIGRLVAAVVTSAMLFGNYVPYVVSAEDTDEPVVTEEASNQISIDSYGSVEDVFFNEAEDVCADEVVWQEPADNWYEDYEYTLDPGKNEIYIKESKGMLSGNIVVPGKAIIDGNDYNVVLDINDRPFYGINRRSIWYSDADNLTGIKIGEGVGLKDGNAEGLFSELSNLLTIDLTGLNTTQLKDMDAMFYECKGVTELNLNGIDTSNVKEMNNLFYDCESLTNLDISNFNTSKTEYMAGMFDGCSGLTELDISMLDTSQTLTMQAMFENCKGLTQLDVSHLNTARVKDMSHIFSKCTGLTSLDLRNLDTANVVDMSGMFNGCSSLSELNLSNFNTSNVTSMRWMFMNCSGLNHIDLSSFDTSNVIYMYDMFYGCKSLINLDLSKFNTAKCIKMDDMFRECDCLKELDMSNFNTSQVTEMDGMFKDCKSLINLNISGFDTTQVGIMTDMFSGCSNLKSIDIRKFIISEDCKVDNMLFESGPNRMLPVNWVKGYDHEKKEGWPGEYTYDNTLTRIYYTGTKEQWEALNNIVPEGVEVLFEQTGEIEIPDDPIPVTGVSIKEGTSFDLNKGNTLTLTAVIVPENATQYTAVTWSSDNEQVASVDAKSGLITALARGKAKITVTTENNKTASCTVKVSDPEYAETDDSPMCPAPVIDETTTELHLIKGQKFTLPGTGWESSDKKTLSISKKNALTAKKDLTAPVKLIRGERSIDVYITKPAYTSKSITLDAGKTQGMGFNYDKDNLAVVWYSNAPDVATVSEKGVVKAVAKGTATITAYVNGTAYNCKVKVKESAVARERTLHLTLNTSKSIKFKGVKKPMWMADDPTIVDIKGNKFKGKAAGTTTLRMKDGENEYIIHLFVEEPDIITKGFDPAGKNKYKVTLKAGESIPIEFVYVDQDVVFKSNKGEIAYNDNGNIVANKEGKAKLTGKINGKTITINVTVTP